MCIEGKKKSIGVIYVACGSKEYVKEAEESALRLKDVNPEIPVTIFSDLEVNRKHLFEDIRGASYKDKRSKIESIIRSPYDVSLYLDSDTYICRDIMELFVLYNQYDIAVSHAPLRFGNRDNEDFYESETNIPESFPEFNTGVMLIRKCESTNRLLRMWFNMYSQVLDKSRNELPRDQPFFRAALYKSNVNTVTLTPEYNVRLNFPAYVERKASILHGRNKNYNKICSSINSDIGPRVYIPFVGTIRWGNIGFRIIRKFKSFLS